MPNEKRAILFPGQTYEVGVDYPVGYYLFSSGWENGDASFGAYKSYPPESWYSSETGYFGFCTVQPEHKFIRIENGVAVYYGTQRFNLCDTLSMAELNDDDFHANGVKVMSNEICEIKVNQRKENGVRVLDWIYVTPINEENVNCFLQENDIVCSETSYQVFNDALKHEEYKKDEMAPVISKKVKQDIKAIDTCKQKLNSTVIRQYTNDGEYICEYNSVREAAEKNGVSEKSINNTIYGVRKSGGGFVWGRFVRGSEIVEMKPIEKKGNNGTAQQIFKLSFGGEIIEEYESIGEAVKATGINRRSISDALSGIQKTAGGFAWKYVNCENE